MVIEDILTYSKFDKCRKLFNNGECFRKEYRGDNVLISIEQSRLSDGNLFRLASVSYGNDILAIPIDEGMNYKELIKEISSFIRRKHGNVE